MTIEYIKVKAKYNYKATQTLKKILKTLRKLSFYMAIDTLADLSASIERTTLLQILYSAVTYAENNNYANLVKIWLEDIHIKNCSKQNSFLSKIYQEAETDNYIIIKLGFEYKTFPVKKEFIW